FELRDLVLPLGNRAIPHIEAALETYLFVPKIVECVSDGIECICQRLAGGTDHMRLPLWRLRVAADLGNLLEPLWRNLLHFRRIGTQILRPVKDEHSSRIHFESA